MHQLVTATKDIHEQNVIHRDLKLGNLLLTDRLEIRVGDFGLAAKVSSRLQRRKTMCGTPNYIAPEILDSIFIVYFRYQWALLWGWYLESWSHCLCTRCWKAAIWDEWCQNHIYQNQELQLLISRGFICVGIRQKLYLQNASKRSQTQGYCIGIT